MFKSCNLTTCIVVKANILIIYIYIFFLKQRGCIDSSEIFFLLKRYPKKQKKKKYPLDDGCLKK